jgi:SAM-dependent methyltransferase
MNVPFPESPRPRVDFDSKTSARWLRQGNSEFPAASNESDSSTNARLQVGDKILDAAGGSTAEYIRAVLERSPFSLNAYCQDSLLNGTREAGITFIGGSIDSIPPPDNSIDGISCHHSFEHFHNDLDIKFIHEAVRLLKPRKKLVIVSLFLTNKYTEIWNRRPIHYFDASRAITIFDPTASFAGWGPYEGFARTYSAEVLRTRIIDNLPTNCKFDIYQVYLDGKMIPTIDHDDRLVRLNREMKALVITKT